MPEAAFPAMQSRVCSKAMSQEGGPAMPTLTWGCRGVFLSSAWFSQISGDARKHEGKSLREV